VIGSRSNGVHVDTAEAEVVLTRSIEPAVDGDGGDPVVTVAVRTVAPSDGFVGESPPATDGREISDAVSAIASAFYATPQTKRPSRSSAVDRTFDLVVGSVMFVLVLPLLAVLVILVRCTSPGPAFYKQVRVGRNGALFPCYKLRTMVPDADRKLADLLVSRPDLAEEFRAQFKLHDDPRVTKVGRLLRRTSLDELPQIINVMRGQMSLVGPRPMVPTEIVRYGEALKRVLTVRPGMTGPWQVSGRSDISYSERIQLDVHFVEHHTVASNLKIMAKTGLMMLQPRHNGAC
jgi:lipopolysaccharide/colanic/teichoic acid biosynthesis glycosyltransferase